MVRTCRVLLMAFFLRNSGGLGLNNDKVESGFLMPMSSPSFIDSSARASSATAPIPPLPPHTARRLPITAASDIVFQANFDGQSLAATVGTGTVSIGPLSTSLNVSYVKTNKTNAIPDAIPDFYALVLTGFAHLTSAQSGGYLQACTSTIGFVGVQIGGGAVSLSNPSSDFWRSTTTINGATTPWAIYWGTNPTLNSYSTLTSGSSLVSSGWTQGGSTAPATPGSLDRLPVLCLRYSYTVNAGPMSIEQITIYGVRGSYWTPCNNNLSCVPMPYTMQVSETKATFKSQFATTYNIDLNYYVAVAPPGPGYRLRTSFTLFDTEPDYDFVYLYTGLAGPFKTKTVMPSANVILGPIAGSVGPTPSYYSLWGESVVASLFSDTGTLARGVTIVVFLESCPSGSYCPTADNSTIPCLSGTYNPSVAANNSAACLQCPVDSYCPAIGMSAPVECPCPGTCLTPGLITAASCSITPSSTASKTVSGTPSGTPSRTPSDTGTILPSLSPTSSPSQTASGTPPPTLTPSATLTPSTSATPSVKPSIPGSQTMTAIPQTMTAIPVFLELLTETLSPRPSASVSAMGSAEATPIPSSLACASTSASAVARASTAPAASVMASASASVTSSMSASPSLTASDNIPGIIPTLSPSGSGSFGLRSSSGSGSASELGTGTMNSSTPVTASVTPSVTPSFTPPVTQSFTSGAWMFAAISVDGAPAVRATARQDKDLAAVSGLGDLDTHWRMELARTAVGQAFRMRIIAAERVEAVLHQRLRPRAEGRYLVDVVGIDEEGAVHLHEVFRKIAGAGIPVPHFTRCGAEVDGAVGIARRRP